MLRAWYAIVIALPPILAIRFYVARRIVSTALNCAEDGVRLLPDDHPARSYATGRIEQARERLVPNLRP